MNVPRMNWERCVASLKNPSVQPNYQLLLYNDHLDKGMVNKRYLFFNCFWVRLYTRGCRRDDVAFAADTYFYRTRYWHGNEDMVIELYGEIYQVTGLTCFCILVEKVAQPTLLRDRLTRYSVFEQKS